MKNYFNGIYLAIAIALALASGAQGAFLYSEDFRSDSVDGWVFEGADGSTAPALTYDEDIAGLKNQNQIDRYEGGWLRLAENETNLSTMAFYDTAFDISQSDVTASFTWSAYNGDGDDGFTFFFSDADSTPTIGSGDLGYASDGVSSGLAGGFLGIGFDSGSDINLNDNTINIYGPGDGTSGYALLTQIQLDPVNQPIAFPDRKKRTIQHSDYYRRATITLTADNQLSVQVQFDPQLDPQTLIENFDLNEALNGITRPDEVLVGFTAASGAGSQYAEVRDFIIEGINNGTVPVIPEPSTVAITTLAFLGIGAAQFSVLRARRQKEDEEPSDLESENQRQ